MIVLFEVSTRIPQCTRAILPHRDDTGHLASLGLLTQPNGEGHEKEKTSEATLYID